MSISFATRSPRLMCGGLLLLLIAAVAIAGCGGTNTTPPVFPVAPTVARSGPSTPSSPSTGTTPLPSGGSLATLSGPRTNVSARADNMPPAVWARGYNDRIFVLTERQAVRLQGAGFASNGYIADAAGNTRWRMVNGQVQYASTLDLQPGPYCLHVDWKINNPAMPVQFSDQWQVDFTGPPQATGAFVSATAVFEREMGTRAKYTPVYFRLNAPQVVTIHSDTADGKPSYSIADANGVMWYWQWDGITQSCSALLSSPNSTPRKVNLPAGTYILWASGRDLRNAVTVQFAGAVVPPFDVPAPIRSLDCCPRAPVDSSLVPTKTSTPTTTSSPRVDPQAVVRVPTTTPAPARTLTPSVAPSATMRVPTTTPAPARSATATPTKTATRARTAAATEAVAQGRWVRTGAPLINSSNPKLPLEYYGGTKDPLYFGEERFAGKYTIYRLSESMIAMDDREVDHGTEYWKATIESRFDVPPPTLKPGQVVPLSVKFSGTAQALAGWTPPGARFQYGADKGHTGIIQPADVLYYNPATKGPDSKTWTLTVPRGSPGNTFEVWAGWWNCAMCNVTWTYRYEAN